MCCEWQDFIVFMDHIPLCVYTTPFGYLGCFLVFAIVNIAVINYRGMYSFLSVVSSGKYPELELLDYMVLLVLVF